MGWFDPLGFAGLDKAAPPFRWPAELRERESMLRGEREALSTQTAEQVDRLEGLQLEVQALGLDGSMARHLEARETELRAGELELRDLRKRTAALDDRIGATRQELERIEAGDLGDPQAHLTHPHRPVPPAETRYGRIVELWSALSVGVLLMVIVAIVAVDAARWWLAVVLAVGGYVVLEAAFRRRLTNVMLTIVVVLAAISAVILVWELRNDIALVALSGLALFILVDNLRELLGR
jgi:hypothetical protein